MTDFDEGALLKRCRRGDLEAFSELVRRHEGWLCAMLRSRLSDWTAADDLAQDTFVTAFRRIRSFRGESAFDAWLRGIATNHFRNFIRKKRELLVGDEDLLPIVEQHGELESSASLEALQLCLEEVPSAGRQLLEDRYFQNRQLQEIAEERGLRYSTVSMQLFRLRELLAVCVEGKLKSW